MTPLEQVIANGCDFPNPPIYNDPRNGGYTCRCLVCNRCRKHTGNNSQGHYWGFCKVTNTIRDHHFCCPGNCELEKS